jgi:signal transduction histidine kinase/DNA-binding LacI/PurR family transcriptional regulator/DNA-binding response OmpR family regulator
MMNAGTPHRTTIGFLSTWSVYEGTTIDDYTHAFIQGVCAAAGENDVNLLIGCGISLPGSPLASRTAWSVSEPKADFIPIGPWNTDALIIIPDDLSDTQFEYVQDLIRSGFPVVMTTTEKPGPLVAVDNAGGIRQAFDHLYQHGHRRIAFVAGKEGRGGDSAERLAAFRQSLRDAGLEEDPRLIAFGEHRREDGRTAMRKILDGGAPFTALLASNDLSGLGAMEVLRAAGRRIPEDVAVIGFDDILEARSQNPPLTTVRHPTFTLGYQALGALLDEARTGRTGGVNLRVATRLIIRQSCGCRIETRPAPSVDIQHPADRAATEITLARLMADAIFPEARRIRPDNIDRLCEEMAHAFVGSLVERNPEKLDLALEEWLKTYGEDATAWDAPFAALRRELPSLLSMIPEADAGMAETMLNRARLSIAELSHRQAADALVKHKLTSDRVGLMTSQLQTALNVKDIGRILTEHLPQLGIQRALAVQYLPREDDPVSSGRILLDVGGTVDATGKEFPTRTFPPPGLYDDSAPFQLAVFPLLIDERTNGFAVLSASNLEPSAAIVHNLASALRTSRLYQDALGGQRAAEEANRLKSRFLSMVSHELRTPLSLIVGLSEMVLRENPEPGDSTRRDIEQINLSAQHLAQLIGDVLDLAGTETGQLRILREPLDLTEVLKVAANIGAQLAHEKGLEWEAQFPAEGPTVKGDRTRLCQVTLNLINNAVKFTSAGKVVLRASADGDQICVSVSDTGIGVPPSERESIFRDFYRSEQAVRSGFGGLGLGLAISKNLVEQHGGSIGVRSPGDLGKGSTFYFTVPKETEAPAAISPRTAERAGTVAILTARGESAEPLSGFLRERGFDPWFCCADEETDWLIRLAAARPTALILGDRLAAREGWALIGMVKRQSGLEQVPVFTYALDAGRDRGELLELNYLQKPLHPEELARELARYCDPAGGPHSILVVDDDPGILDLHSRLVKQIGCRPITARNGREALEEIGRAVPDLILLDLMMPEMDGFAVLEQLQAREALRNVPVIIVTARVLSESDLAHFHRGVASILSKGMFTAAETLEHIGAALERQQTLGRATQQLVHRAIACIHVRYAEPLTRDDIARQVGISADYLTDCFHQELGITPMTYLRRYRILRARSLLETSELPILQIAMQTGFSDGTYFTRTFQREVGMSPRAYRRSRRG